IQGAGDDSPEYLEYTINVTKTGFYDLNVTHNKPRDGEFNQMRVSLPDEDTVLIDTFTGRDSPTNVEYLTDLMGNIMLTEGNHVLRFTMVSFGFNLEKFELAFTHSAIMVTFNDGSETTSAYVDPDGTVQLPPDPSKEGEVFVQWVTSTGEVFDSNTVVTEDTEVFAQWEIKSYAIQFTAENGTVSFDPDQSEFPVDSEVTLTAIPDTGYEFVEWSGDASGSENPITIMVDKEINVVASFALKTYSIDITSENGTILLDPESDQSEFPIDSEVTLTAIPDEGYDFVEWSGDASGSENPLTIMIDKNMSIVAEFMESEVLSALDDTYGVKIYPNPSDDHIFIEGAPKGTIITLFSIDGSKVETIEIDAKKFQMDITHLERGQYILVIKETEKKAYYKKIITE
ncbi:MAG: InlB B-repeat-containing protein, partial [Cyclobacteriaceae bacterium]